jgi:hypothetical protein
MIRYRTTASGQRVQSDEVPQHIQFAQADLIRKRDQARDARARLERLKAANKVPLRQGVKLFDEFMRDALIYI